MKQHLAPLFAIASIAAGTIHGEERSAQLADIRPIGSGIVKGSGRDYYATDLARLNLAVTKAFSFASWAGEIYLQDEDKSGNPESAASQLLIAKAPEEAANFGKNFCATYLGNAGIRSGYFLVDHFDLTYNENKKARRVVWSGNVTCLMEQEISPRS